MSKNLMELTEEKALEIRRNARALGHKIGRSLDDAWIYAKIGTRLTSNAVTEALNIHVDVIKGVVTLHGDVVSQAAKVEAEMIARDTDGVEDVRNHLEVRDASSSRDEGS